MSYSLIYKSLSLSLSMCLCESLSVCLCQYLSVSLPVSLSLFALSRLYGKRSGTKSETQWSLGRRACFMGRRRPRKNRAKPHKCRLIARAHNNGTSSADASSTASDKASLYRAPNFECKRSCGELKLSSSEQESTSLTMYTALIVDSTPLILTCGAHYRKCIYGIIIWGGNI